MGRERVGSHKEPQTQEGNSKGLLEDAGYDGHSLTLLRKIASVLKQ